MKTIYLFLVASLLFACKPVQNTNENVDKELPALQASITGTWKLQDSKITFSDRIKNNATITFTIDDINLVSGTTGCNSFRNSFTYIDEKLTFLEPFAMTKMLCQDAKDESKFMEELKKCSIAKIQGNQLHLYQNTDLWFTFVREE